MSKYGQCSCWRPSSRYLPYANGECIGTKECDPCNCNGDEEKCDYYEHVCKRGAEKKKTADMIEVVRCKDCKYCEILAPVKEVGKEAVIGYKCLLIRTYKKAEGFCDYGERRNENAE